MAHKKAGGSSKNGRDSKPKMLGLKRHDGPVCDRWKHHCETTGNQIPPRS